MWQLYTQQYLAQMDAMACAHPPVPLTKLPLHRIIVLCVSCCVTRFLFVVDTRQLSFLIYFKLTILFVRSLASRRFACRPAVTTFASGHDAVRTSILAWWRRSFAYGDQSRSMIFYLDSGHCFSVRIVCFCSSPIVFARHDAPCLIRAPLPPLGIMLSKIFQ